jgi:hypothetical protein
MKSNFFILFQFFFSVERSQKLGINKKKRRGSFFIHLPHTTQAFALPLLHEISNAKVHVYKRAYRKWNTMMPVHTYYVDVPLPCLYGVTSLRSLR